MLIHLFFPCLSWLWKNVGVTSCLTMVSFLFWVILCALSFLLKDTFPFRCLIFPIATVSTVLLHLKYFPMPLMSCLDLNWKQWFVVLHGTKSSCYCLLRPVHEEELCRMETSGKWHLRDRDLMYELHPLHPKPTACQSPTLSPAL